MKKSIYWILAAILICGTTVITSCSNDESSVRYEASVNVEQSTALVDALNKVRDNMGKTNFQGLTPLSTCLNQGTASFGSSEMDNESLAKFCEALKALLEGLCGNGENGEPAQTWQLGELIKTLQSTFNMSQILEQLADNNFLGNNEYNRSFDIVLSDTLVYTVDFEKKRTIETTATSLSGNILRKLTINKNGSVLLTIDTTQDNAAGVADNKFGFAAAKTGTLCYGNAKFTFDRQRQGINSVVTSLTYLSDDTPMVTIKTKSDNNLSWESFQNNEMVFKGNLEANLLGGLIGIVSDVSDLYKFYALGLAMGAFDVAGTTKENCQKHTDMINSIVNSHITMLGEDCGAITFEPILRDSNRNTYVPSLMLTGEGGEKVPIKEALEALGITFENLMQMLFSE